MLVTRCSYAIAEVALTRARGDSGRAVVLILEGEVGGDGDGGGEEGGGGGSGSGGF